MYKPSVRSPRSIAEAKNSPELFQGDGNYNGEAGLPIGVSDGNPDRGEDRYRVNPTNPAEPPAPWAQKKA